MKKLLLLLVLAIFSIVMVACGGDNGEEEGAQEGETPDVEDELPTDEEDLEEMEVSDVDEDEVVATVDGEEITGAELLQGEQAVGQQYAQIGMDPQQNPEMIREAALEQVINSKVVELAAIEEGYEPSEEELDEEINNQISGIQEQQGLESEEDVYEEIEMTEEEVRDEISTMLLINNYLEESIEESSASEEEIEEAYEEYAAQMEEMEEEVGELDEVRDQLETQVMQQKESEQMEEMINNLRDQSDIEILI
ncbi:SurA N-terminal domain-containing protein [Alkalibacillus haloalkaliphilus]|uniref:SurA N-terminal domain-containing protein n=1 Tax=Alkalibacillus haloalkaliphilus TaxID=94136 RepID=UPI0029355C23|nr:SurA N-terminal domain-containing protein [Alkalibacillus haloalkaliphilus]MDV2583050.1 SurA N-terminal domain-containing protein [Alkalibacillus haloalkaliphilus]